MTEAMQIAIVTALVNAAVTWGVISTKLAWLRRDIDSLTARFDLMEFGVPARRIGDRGHHQAHQE